MASTIAVVVAFLVIAAAASAVFASDPNNPTGPSARSFSVFTTSQADAATGLTLGLELNATTITSGQTIELTASEYNSLPTMNNVTGASDWPIKGLGVSVCGTVNDPFGIAVFRGYYTASDISSAKALQRYPPYGLTSCPMILSEISQYQFYPKSSRMQIWGSCSPELCQVVNATASLSVNGFWTGVPIIAYNVHMSLAPGVYTVAAGDEWGQLVLLYFAVKS